MLLKNLKSGWRNILKNKLFTSINIFGLSIGLAVATLILFWVVDELNFDKFHENINQIYTVYEHQQYSDGQELFTPCTPFPLSKMLATDFDEVEQATTFTDLNKIPFKFEDKQHIIDPVLCVDENFLKIYRFKVIDGDIDALSAPDKIVITPEIVELYFGNENPIGKVLQMQNQYALEVGAVVERPGKNSSFDFKVILPLKFLGQNWTNIDSWGGNWPRTTVQLSKQANAGLFADKIVDICKEHGQQNTTLHLFPFKDEHLYSYSGDNNRIQYIYQFLAIAFIIILIASINFVNFSTARSVQRKPEIGIRKSLGASKVSLVRLFLHEKGLTVAISMLISILLVVLFVPVFSKYAGKTIDLSLLKNSYFILMIIGVLVTTIVLSIVYPALYMSASSPAQVLKRQMHNRSMFSFKNTLVVLQFALSIGLIICSIFISSQLNYIQNYNLGYNKDGLIFLEFSGNSSDNHEAVFQEVGKVPGIKSLSRCRDLPFWGGSSSWGFNWDGKETEREILFSHRQVDLNYLSTMEIQFADGVNFSDYISKLKEGEEPAEIILNEEAIRVMGMDKPIGKHFWSNDGEKAKIVGVVKDYNFESLRNKVEPLIILPLTENPRFLIVRVEPDNLSNTIAEIRTKWDELCPDTECTMGFFDSRLEELYSSEQRIAGLFKSFTLIAIFISCIGLFGLSLYAIETRRKEIGIRKVNGSTRIEIISLINSEFISKVIVAFIIASPLSFFIMTKWLQNFAYKTDLSWWVFLLSGFIALCIAILTISWQSWKAATRNPVESLRYE